MNVEHLKIVYCKTSDKITNGTLQIPIYILDAVPEQQFNIIYNCLVESKIELF